MENFNAAHDQRSKQPLFVTAMVTGSNTDLLGLILMRATISHSSFKKSGKLKRKRVLLGVSLRFVPKFSCFTPLICKSNHIAVLILPSGPFLAISSSQLVQWWPSHCLSCDCSLSNIHLQWPFSSCLKPDLWGPLKHWWELDLTHNCSMDEEVQKVYTSFQIRSYLIQWHLTCWSCFTFLFPTITTTK